MSTETETCATCHSSLVKQNVWINLTPSQRATATNDGYRRKAAHGICCRCYERETRSPEGRAIRAEVARARAERMEDLRWMAEGGESLAGAATRLGITVGAIEKFLRHEPELLRTLTTRNPRDWNRTTLGDGLPTTRTPQAVAKRNANRNEKRRAARRESRAAA